MNRRIKNLHLILTAIIILIGWGAVGAENFVDWPNGYWVAIPDGWVKVDFKIADRMFAYTDTSVSRFNYRAVLAPQTDEMYPTDAYMVITFDSLGSLTQSEAETTLRDIADSYSNDVYEAPIVEYLSDLVPGRPKLDLENRSLEILSEMAFRPEAKMKLLLYVKLGPLGLVTMYCYSSESTFEANKPFFRSIIASLSFEKLREAAGQNQTSFTDVGASTAGDPGSSEGGKDAASMGTGTWLLIGAAVIVVFGLLWVLVIAPRRKRDSLESETRPEEKGE